MIAQLPLQADKATEEGGEDNPAAELQMIRKLGKNRADVCGHACFIGANS